MTTRGRPKGGAQMSRESILAAAFDLLDNGGHEALSMRGLAAHLSVTPMALYHHFPDRSALVREMSDAVYAKAITDFNSQTGTSRRKVESLLGLYYQAIVQYPDLTVLIFATPGEFSSSLLQINKSLTELLSEANVKGLKKKNWLDILVDFTHGSALATAIHQKAGGTTSNTQKKIYQRQLGELLGCIFN